VGGHAFILEEWGVAAHPHFIERPKQKHAFCGLEQTS
jgi:hypothetical protein